MDIKLRIRKAYNILFRPDGVFGFFKFIPDGSRVLDVGCGNNSPYVFKTLYPNIIYTGIDVGDYNQQKPVLADAYVITTPEKFHIELAKLGQFDAVISSHNLEHVDNRIQTLLAMMGAVKQGGDIYIAFPTEDSINFPSRSRTLNYYDDPTHKENPPSFDWVCRTLENSGFVIERKFLKYRPFPLRCLGWLQEPLARRKNIILQGTWAYYGFESLIWARKIKK